MTMIRAIRLAVVFTLVSAAIATVGSAAASVRTVPAGTHRISSANVSDLHEQLRALAGDRSHLIYEAFRLDADGHRNPGSARAYVRDGSGRPRSLGRVSDFEGGYRIVGHMVTSESLKTPQLTDQVNWWNLKTRTSGFAPLPKNHLYIDASRDGFLFVKGNVVYDQATSGAVTRIGAPFSDEAPDEISSTTRGFVASGHGGQAAYYAFASSRFTRLTTGTHYRLGCGPAVSGLVACAAVHPREDDAARRGVDLLSLSGKPAVFRKGVASIPAVSKDGMSWIARHHLLTVSESGKQVRRTKRVDAYGGLIEDSVVSGLGSVVFTANSQTQLVRTVAANKPIRHVRTAPRSPVAVSSFAIGGGRVAWREDSGAGGKNLIVVASMLNGVASHLSTVPASPAGRALAVSDTTLAIGADRNGHVGLAIDSTAGHSTFVNGITYTNVQVAGTRVLYLRNRASHPGDPDGQAYVYDAATGVTKKVGPLLYERATAHRGFDYFQPAAIAAGRVVYQELDGTVEDEILATGVTEKLRGKGDPALDSELTAPEVFAAGDYAGWNQGLDDGYRNVVTLGPEVTLTARTGEFDEIAALSDAGVVYRNSVRAAADASQFFLAPYGDSTGPIVLRGDELSAPRIAATSMIWLNRDDVLDAASIAN